MITTRSSILLVIAGMALFGGLLNSSEPVALAGLALLVWLAIQWVGVRWALRSAHGVIRQATRRIDGDSLDRQTLAVDQEYTVQLKGKLDRQLRGFRITLRDTVAAGCEVVEGHCELSLDRRKEQLFSLVYQMKPVICGHMELAGIGVVITDPNGMFCGQAFVPLRQKLTVLPFLIRPQSTNSVLKTNNLQRILGHHRHPRPGISAELLGIRDYRPGDPPRSIAWKPTARLDRLMSREFESEVPIRATILCDLSAYQFTGRPGPAVADRVITGVASISRLLLADRDPVAVVLASERGSTRIPHGHGERHLGRVMHYLLAAANPNPRIEYLSDRVLTKLVFRECFRRFPELFDRRTSFIPTGRTLLRPVRGKYQRIRCRLAPVLCELLKLPPGREFRLIHDANALRDACEAWAREYPLGDVPGHTASVDGEREMRHAAIKNLAARLISCRTRARDQELLVVVASLPTDPDDATRLKEVIRVCRAAGHRVVFADAGFPGYAEQAIDPLAREILENAARRREAREPSTIQKDLGALGVAFARITDPALIEKVAMETRLIGSGRARGGSRASIH